MDKLALSGLADNTPLPAIWCLGRGKDAPPTCHSHLWWVRELTLLLTSCSTQKIRPCISPGQPSRADLINKSASEPRK